MGTRRMGTRKFGFCRTTFYKCVPCTRAFCGTHLPSLRPCKWKTGQAGVGSVSCSSFYSFLAPLRLALGGRNDTTLSVSGVGGWFARSRFVDNQVPTIAEQCLESGSRAPRGSHVKMDGVCATMTHGYSDRRIAWRPSSRPRWGTFFARLC